MRRYFLSEQQELEIRVETQKQTLAARDESIKKLLEMLQNKGVGEFSLLLWAALNNWHKGIPPPKIRVTTTSQGLSMW